MITLNGIIISDPSKYSFSQDSLSNGHYLFNTGFKTYGKASKYIGNLEFDNLTQDEYNTIKEIYDSQFTDFMTISFSFSNGNLNDSINNIEVIMKYSNSKKNINNYRNLSFVLEEV